MPPTMRRGTWPSRRCTTSCAARWRRARGRAPASCWRQRRRAGCTSRAARAGLRTAPSFSTWWPPRRCARSPTTNPWGWRLAFPLPSTGARSCSIPSPPAPPTTRTPRATCRPSARSCRRASTACCASSRACTWRARAGRSCATGRGASSAPSPSSPPSCLPPWSRPRRRRTRREAASMAGRRTGATRTVGATGSLMTMTATRLLTWHPRHLPLAPPALQLTLATTCCPSPCPLRCTCRLARPGRPPQPCPCPCLPQPPPPGAACSRSSPRSHRAVQRPPRRPTQPTASQRVQRLLAGHRAGSGPWSRSGRARRRRKGPFSRTWSSRAWRPTCGATPSRQARAPPRCTRPSARAGTTRWWRR
mmetsp:Transcript_32871/g.83410  ORF Transcript_32871/g.83410 Transcript_32871/m.83410 type:complete len:362 (+) Transcript_32871:98-1183(+)